MARRVRTRKRIGPQPGAMLRSVYPPVVALGGWSLGALIASRRCQPSVDNELLIVLSVGAPVGLDDLLRMGAPRLAASNKRAGLAAAAAAALAGEWLGVMRAQ